MTPVCRFWGDAAQELEESDGRDPFVPWENLGDAAQELEESALNGGKRFFR